MSDIKAEVVVWLLTTAVPIVGLYITNKTKIKESEHRQTVLEMEVKHLSEKVERNAVRLDEHDEQNKNMARLIERVGILTEAVNEVKQDVKLIRKEHV